MLTSRQKLILKAIIEEYVSSNEPIGSKVLTEKPNLAFSSATLRYEMQHLEELGYLLKTHTSSGRVPSEMGYRYYVDHLITRDDDVSKYFKYIDEIFDLKYQSKDLIIKKLITFISELTQYYTAIIGSSSDYAKVFKMEIVPISQKEAVLLIVTSTGLVQSQKISIPNGYKMDDLMRIIQMFDNAVYGHSVYEISEILSREASKPRIRQMVDFQDDILNFMVNAFQGFLDKKMYNSGLSKLFTQPEFKNPDVMRRILLSIDNEVVKAFAAGAGSGLQVHIGTQNYCNGLEDCSIITIPYYVNDDEYGTILLVGPTRMNYQGAIPLLEYVARSMNKLNDR